MMHNIRPNMKNHDKELFKFKNRNANCTFNDVQWNPSCEATPFASEK